jgi:hypothetical protein
MQLNEIDHLLLSVFAAQQSRKAHFRPYNSQGREKSREETFCVGSKFFTCKGERAHAAVEEPSVCVVLAILHMMVIPTSKVRNTQQF